MFLFLFYIKKAQDIVIHLGGSPQTCTRYEKPTPLRVGSFVYICSLLGVVIFQGFEQICHAPFGTRCKYIVFFLQIKGFCEKDMMKNEKKGGKEG